MQYTDEYLLDAIAELTDSADSTGCTEDLTVVSSQAVAKLCRLLKLKQQTNEKARDLPALAQLAVETQDAANPRPLSVLLSNLIHTVMANGGNPGYQNSAAVRLVIHQLLWLLDGSSLPAYDKAAMLYHQDVEACEALATQKV